MLGVIYAACHMQARCGDCHYVKYHYAELHYSECHYAERRYTECLYAEIVAPLQCLGVTGFKDICFKCQ